MLKNTFTRKNQKGFTLIEVVLVLAIGGLIFLLAFLAFQQVSTNRRDTQRRSDAAKIVAELQNYTADGKSVNNFRELYGFRISNPDSSPVDICSTTETDPFIASFTRVYVCKNNVFKSPNGSNYRVIGFTSDLDTTALAPIIENGVFFLGVGCNSEAGKVSVRMKLEKGTVCRDA